jgi:hypothetical protein
MIDITTFLTVATPEEKKVLLELEQKLKQEHARVKRLLDAFIPPSEEVLWAYDDEEDFQ